MTVDGDADLVFVDGRLLVASAARADLPEGVRVMSLAEAATEAGDLIYRWGNPQAHARGGPEDQILWGQHDALWIPEGRPGAGNITVYNNGNDRPEGTYSTVEEITPPLLEDGTYELIGDDTYGPPKTDTCFIYDPPTDFFSSFISGAQRLPSGNTLIASGSKGRLFEVTREGEIVWEFLNPHGGDRRIKRGGPPDRRDGPEDRDPGERRTDDREPRGGRPGDGGPPAPQGRRRGGGGPSRMAVGAMFRAIRISPEDPGIKALLGESD